MQTLSLSGTLVSVDWLASALHNGAAQSADLVVLDARSAPEAILLQAAKLAVVKGGIQVSGPLQIAPLQHSPLLSFH